VFRKKKENIVVTITANNRSFVEKVEESRNRISRSPDYYEDIHFVLDSKESVEHYRRHFVYQYLQSLSKTGDLPPFVLRAEKLEITVKKEKE
jgi:hypothetical protein